MKPLFTFFAIILIFSTITVSSQTLSWQEKEILKQIDEDLDEAKDFLIQVVNVNSGTMNHEGVRKVGKLFGDAFNELSMKSRWVSLPDSVNRAGHLVVEKVGGTGKKLLLIGHLDTVFEEDSPFQKYEPIGDGKAKAPGGQDMKGGDVVILYALKALHDAGMINDATITVVMTGDEEKPGRPLSVSREALIEAGKRSDIALGFEGGRPGFGVVARRSSSGWKLEVEGTRSHSSRIFSENVGSGAIFEVARILNGFHEDVKGEEFLTFNPGVILGGTMVDYDPALNKGTAFGKNQCSGPNCRGAGRHPDDFYGSAGKHPGENEEHRGKRQPAGYFCQYFFYGGLSAHVTDGRKQKDPGRVGPGEPRPGIRPR
jgi:glutamate carboxypeptidase